MNFKDDFPELANSLRKQIKTRRELLGKSQKELLAEINDSFAQNFDISSIVRLEKEDNKNPDKNLNLQLIYYVLRILDLKFDAILFPPKIQT